MTKGDGKHVGEYGGLCAREPNTVVSCCTETEKSEATQHGQKGNYLGE